MSKLLKKSKLIVAAAVAATPVRAEITANEYWEAWRTVLTISDTFFTVDVTETPGEVILENFTFYSYDPQTDLVPLGGNYRLVIPQVVFSDGSEGTVDLDQAESFFVEIEGFVAMPVGHFFRLHIATEGVTGTVSGDPGNYTYEFSVDEMYATELELVDRFPTIRDFSEGAVRPDLPTFNIDFHLTDWHGFEETSFNPNGDTIRRISYSAAGLDLSRRYHHPAIHEEGEFHEYEISVADLQVDTNETYPEGFSPQEELQEWMVSGFSASADLSMGQSSFDYMDQDHQIPGQYGLAVSDTTLSIGFAEGQFDIIFDLGNPIGYGTRVPPLRSQASADLLSVEVSTPLTISDDPVDYSLRLGLENLRLNDEAWNVFDPNANILRERATLRADISGLGRIIADLFDEDTPFALSPVELHTVTVNDLDLSLGGMAMDASADLRFLTPQNLEEFPIGHADISITGGLGLIQSLLDAGLLLPQQAGMARGVMMMFGVPTDQADSFTSRFESSQEEGLTANGLPLPF